MAKHPQDELLEKQERVKERGDREKSGALELPVRQAQTGRYLQNGGRGMLYQDTALRRGPPGLSRTEESREYASGSLHYGEYDGRNALRPGSRPRRL